MRFYDCATAPSPRRVRIFLAEKGISLETVQVDLRNNEQLTPAFRAINPDCTVPALQLDDGTVIGDAIAICQYLEELHPEPALIGSSPQERAVVNALNRQIERDGFYAAMDAFRNAAKGLKGRALPGPHDYEQIPELAARGRTRLGHFLTDMNARLTTHHTQGARLHTNSWGDDNTTQYNSLCRGIDVFSYNNEDDLICFAVTMARSRPPRPCEA